MRNNNKEEVVIIKDYPMRKSIIGHTAIFIMLFLAGIISVPITIKYGVDIPILLALILTVVSMVLASLFGLKFTGEHRNWKSFLQFRKPTRKTVLQGLGAGFLLFLGLQGLAKLLNVFNISLESSDTSNSVSSLTGVSKYVVLIGFVTLLVPLVEEIFYRGVIFQSLNNGKIKNDRVRLFYSVIFTSIIFGLSHFQGFSSASDVVLVLWITLVAVVNNVLLVKHKNIWVAVFSHMAYNGTSALIMLIAGS